MDAIEPPSVSYRFEIPASRLNREFAEVLLHFLFAGSAIIEVEEDLSAAKGQDPQADSVSF